MIHAALPEGHPLPADRDEPPRVQPGPLGGDSRRPGQQPAAGVPPPPPIGREDLGRRSGHHNPHPDGSRLVASSHRAGAWHSRLCCAGFSTTVGGGGLNRRRAGGAKRRILPWPLQSPDAPRTAAVFSLFRSVTTGLLLTAALTAAEDFRITASACRCTKHLSKTR